MYHFKRLFVSFLYYLVLLIIEVTRPGDPYSAATHFGGVTDWYQSQGYREPASDEEIEEPMKDHPLSVDASPTALSPGYIANSDPEEDKEDPEEDPADLSYSLQTDRQL
ncbi:hypothetical protein Tco_0545531 [Tanacetum coccineum]